MARTRSSPLTPAARWSPFRSAALKHGAQVRGKTIGDMGNGQPISMVAYRDGDGDKLFITNVGRGPDDCSAFRDQPPPKVSPPRTGRPRARCWTKPR